MSDNYSGDIDVSSNNEPDAETHFTMRRDSDYERLIEGMEPNIQQLDEMGAEYEHKRPF